MSLSVALCELITRSQSRRRAKHLPAQSYANEPTVVGRRPSGLLGNQHVVSAPLRHRRRSGASIENHERDAARPAGSDGGVWWGELRRSLPLGTDDVSFSNFHNRCREFVFRSLFSASYL